MVDFRPHILKWRTAGQSTTDIDGYDIPGIPGELKELPCRFHQDGKDVKNFILDDGSTVLRQGQIRLGVGVELPKVGQEIEVEGYFKGVVRDVYRGQLSYRIDV